MSEQDLTYFVMRAENERALAHESATPQIDYDGGTLEALASGEVELLPARPSGAARPNRRADRSRFV